MKTLGLIGGMSWESTALYYRDLVHRIIYEEFCRGVTSPEAKASYLAEIERLRRVGADGVILGCTEITMLIGAGDVDLPVLDTTCIHAEAAMEFALAETPAADIL